MTADVVFVDTETRPRIGRPPLPWDGRCRRCGKDDGPFYGRDHVCGRCRTKARRERERVPGPVRDAALARGRRYASKAHRERRQRVLAAYGGRCQCCGIDEPIFLAIDHVDGAGNQHRRSLTSNGSVAGSPKFYAWLEANDYPGGFQILCHNCNVAKHNGGCPHAR